MTKGASVNTTQQNFARSGACLAYRRVACWMTTAQRGFGIGSWIRFFWNSGICFMPVIIIW